jgi:hypothetical protein
VYCQCRGVIRWCFNVARRQYNSTEILSKLLKDGNADGGKLLASLTLTCLSPCSPLSLEKLN